MERLSKRESILLSYNPQRSSTNPSTPNRNSDVDFHDVFGGPPRRSSIHDMRCSIGELQMKDEAPSCPSPRVREKPVFGQDNSNRRRYSKDNFFDDIFGGDESPSCTPRKHERDPFSRISSPAPSLHPGPDSFPTSPLPPTLSLPTFGSPTRSLRKNKKDGTSSGLSSSDSPATLPSRFSSQATQGKQELNHDLGTYGQSLLSQEFSDLSMSGKADKGNDSAGQFHFSIYKWASKGIPLVMPLRAERNSRTKEKVKLERCSSAKDWIVSESTGSSLRRNIIQDGSTTFTSLKSEADSRQFVKEIASVKLHLETLSSLQNDIKDVSVSEIGLSGKMKGDSENANETHKPKSKPLHSLFSESDDKQDYDGNTKRVTGKESKTKKSSAICNVSINPKKQEEKTVALKGVEVSKASSQGSLSLDDNMGNGQVKGKVKEFVRIFNQEAVTKPRIDTKSRIQVEDNPERYQKEDSAIETTNISVNNSSRQDVISASAIPDSTVAVGDKDGFFHGNFLVEELAQDESEVLQTQDNQEIKVIEDKIRQWSNGKEGNIRSLLSTLQYVLWPESGWKPVPLVDIIEGNAVKRAYQRALLCLHPDKLQQKGAASDNKYIAEKVYDILQEAWTHFNVLGAL